MLTAESTAMFAEAGEAPAAVARQGEAIAALDNLIDRLHTLDPAVAFTCARGSSDHAATYAKFLIETRLGVPVVSQSPSLASIYGRGARMHGSPFFVISQSGRSPDLLLSAKAARDAGALVVALVNDTASPLAECAEIVLPLAAGVETSVAATKSFIATLAMIARLVAHWSHDDALTAAVARLPDVLATAWNTDWTGVAPELASAQSLFVLGRGSTLGVAQEAALKFKETGSLHAEAFSIAEVIHGPMALVDDGFPILVLPPFDADFETARPMLDTLAQAGARLLIAGQPELPVLPGIHPALAPIVMIQSFYRLANAVAVARGHDPDHPPLLRKVTRTR